MPNHPDHRPPDVVDGEIVDVRPGPRSPLDPDDAGHWPTVLRPARPDQHGPRPGPLARLLAALRGGAR